MRANCNAEILITGCGAGFTEVFAIGRAADGVEALKIRGFRVGDPIAGTLFGVVGLTYCGLGRNSASASCRALMIRWRSSL